MLHGSDRIYVIQIEKNISANMAIKPQEQEIDKDSDELVIDVNGVPTRVKKVKRQLEAIGSVELPDETYYVGRHRLVANSFKVSDCFAAPRSKPIENSIG